MHSSSHRKECFIKYYRLFHPRFHALNDFWHSIRHMRDSVNTHLLAVSLQTYSSVRETPTPDPLLDYFRIRFILIPLSGGQPSSPVERVGMPHHQKIIITVTKQMS